MATAKRSKETKGLKAAAKKGTVSLKKGTGSSKRAEGPQSKKKAVSLKKGIASPGKKGKASAKRATKTAPKAALKKKAALAASKASQPAITASPKTARGPRTTRIDEIRKKLQRQKEAILTEAEAAMNALPDQTIFPDLGDQAAVECDMSFMLRLRGREQRLLKKIDEALDRIENDIFGICDVCGEEIDINRLYARPVTTMCIHCKTEQEAEEKLMGA